MLFVGQTEDVKNAIRSQRRAIFINKGLYTRIFYKKF